MLNEKTIRDTIRFILTDDRFNLPAAERFGNAYHNAGSISIGYDFPHTRTANGKEIFGDTHEGWFISLNVHNQIINISVITENGLKCKSKDAATAYVEIMSIVDKIHELTTNA